MPVEQNKKFAPNLLFQITLFIYLLILIFFGMTICGLCLRQQDICFILALGRFIVENGRLPDTDPFSWTYAIYPNGCPFVVHQWLTDVIFYLLVKNFTAISLVLITATSLALAFLALPLQAMKRLQLSPIQTLLLASISALAACSHVQARPEIFFYLFVSIYYVILVKADQDKRLSNSALILLVLTMILWSNLHSGFVAGLIILCFWLILSFIDQVILGVSRQRYWGEPFPLLHELGDDGTPTGAIRPLTSRGPPAAIAGDGRFQAHGQAGSRRWARRRSGWKYHAMANAIAARPTPCRSGPGPAGTTFAISTRITTRLLSIRKKPSTGCRSTSMSAVRSMRCCTCSTRGSGTRCFSIVDLSPRPSRFTDWSTRA